MTDRTIPLSPGESVVVTGSKLTTNDNDAKTRQRVTDGRPKPPIPPTPVPGLTYTSSITGGVLKGKVPWTATVTSGKATAIEFYIDGVLRWTESFAPYTFNGDPGGLLDTTTLTDGPHALGVLGVGTGSTGLFAGGTVTIDNTGVVIPPTEPPLPGSEMPTTVPAGWRLVMAEDFNTPCAEGSWPGPYAANWGAYPKDWKDTARSQGRRGGLYDPAMISVANGEMRVRFATIAGTRRIAVPRLQPNGNGSFRSGLVEYAIQVENVVGNGYGYKTALLWWPDDGNWPKNGEIDFAEGDLDATIGGFMHRQGATSGSDQASAIASGAKYTDKHVCALEWKGGALCEYRVDGKPILHETNRVPNTSMHYVFQCETSLSSHEAADSTTGYIKFDWVRFMVPA